jgi:hypothetical protein
MKLRLTLIIVAAIALALPFASQAATVGGNAVPHYNGSGNVWGVKCIFPSNAGGASVNVQFTLDGGTTRTITLDPTYYEQEEFSRFVSEWIPMDLTFSSSVRIQLNNTGLGTTTIDCWASWGTN